MEIASSVASLRAAFSAKCAAEFDGDVESSDGISPQTQKCDSKPSSVFHEITARHIGTQWPDLSGSGKTLPLTIELYPQASQ
ncbi:MAG: hypothetical protein ABSD63_12210 [Candidatus Korobacteraceae bacterium]|jgi:hypothetical protein